MSIKIKQLLRSLSFCSSAGQDRYLEQSSEQTETLQSIEAMTRNKMSRTNHAANISHEENICDFFHQKNDYL